MMADEVRMDFLASHNIIERMSEHSAVARRALPMLNRLRERIRSGGSSTGSNTTTPVTVNSGDAAQNELLDMLFGTW